MNIVVNFLPLEKGGQEGFSPREQFLTKSKIPLTPPFSKGEINHLMLFMLTMLLACCGNYSSQADFLGDASSSCTAQTGYFCDSSNNLKPILDGLCGADTDCPTGLSCNSDTHQ